ncbi:S49 family peptidase [Chitinimonas arctica]|uniref:S49 family peptidase n=1 Tax=Chitinimonas arctica TaxID=2594795 RepID=A0A516SJ44_9NEIS|nr:S49 family peptidase [Chitinimonas arctica]QDQ28182.1 S49 family peptidase [Chitinimonas arctica]
MNEQQDPTWERQVLEKLVVTALKEQRKGRNWGIFFKLAGFTWLFLVLLLIVTWRFGDRAEAGTTGPHTALIDLTGVIAAGENANADNVNEGLRNAFKDKNTKGVILRINSPGGSPVQAGQINDEIQRQRKLHPDIPLYVVVDDICASGGYYVAVAADKIFVDKASLVGSIGVLMDGFGFTGAMDKLGVERRLLTAGANKGFLDPFSPQSDTQVQFAKQMLTEVHEQFIGVVRKGRGKRLKETPDMFSGLVWSGEKSVAMGLADDFGNADSVARDVIKAAEIVDFTPREDWAQRFARSIGASAGAKLGSYFDMKLK